jgi:hypothetical protein
VVRTFIPIVLLKVILFTACVGIAPANRASCYVAPGYDRNPGTVDAPSATLAHARDLARDTPRAIVYLRSGTYCPPSKYELAERALFILQQILGKHAGKQDEHAAAFGGLNYVSFHPETCP